MLYKYIKNNRTKSIDMEIRVAIEISSDGMMRYKSTELSEDVTIRSYVATDIY